MTTLILAALFAATAVFSVDAGAASSQRQDWASADGNPPYPMQAPASLTDEQSQKLKEAQKKSAAIPPHRPSPAKAGRPQEEDWASPDGKSPFPMQAPATLTPEQLRGLKEAQSKAKRRAAAAPSAAKAGDLSRQNWAAADGKAPYPMQAPAQLTEEQRKALKESQSKLAHKKPGTAPQEKGAASDPDSP